MEISVIAVGKRMPAWINEGYLEYAKRLSTFNLKTIEIPLATRTKTTEIPKQVAKEGEQMLAAIPTHNWVVALDVKGELWDTPTLAKQLQTWQSLGKNVSLLIGGPDGLAPACLQRANCRWSLSPLTLPHPLVRIILAEQLYRAWSILAKHPYHR